MYQNIASYWGTFKRTFIGRILRILVSQQLINVAEHLPLAVLANVVYGFPSRKLKVIGVTGTDGKTTTVNMIYHILKDAGMNVSMISTINAIVGKKVYDTGLHVTSPDPFTVQKLLKEAVEAKNDYIVLEVTSHALDQYRFWGVDFEVGVITNITHDHLDYHKTWENYFLTKAKLIKNVKVAVINRDEDHFGKLSKLGKGKVVSFGISKVADFNPQQFPLELNIFGDFNLLNGLAASAVCSSIGIDTKIIKKSLTSFKPLPGRMEEVKNNHNIKIFIDFAHTPNGLEQALKAIRKTTKRKLIIVFGGDGQRDFYKRPLMGAIAKKLADFVVITASDARGELAKINQQIFEGARKEGAKKDENLFIIDDRQEAINFAIRNLAQEGDTVCVTGKGHEKSLNVDGVHENPWSDIKAIQKALS